jgi:2-succinyl-6-hydroxy-2,4-cyclohexadiene-1-carboxylate synthase
MPIDHEVPPPLILLHGFTQTGRCFGPLAHDLALDRDVLAPDLPGHGGNARLADLDCPEAADHLVDTCTDGHRPADWLGYSLGGRIALHVALRHPERVRRLVLVSATAGIEEPASRAARAREDRARAAHLEEVGVQRFLAEWLRMPMFAGLAPWARFADERATNTAAGLAGSLRRCGTGSMEPLWDRLDELHMPVLVVAGALDEPYVHSAARLATTIGDGAAVEIVPGAHHAAHLEDPVAVAVAVRRFLDSAPSDGVLRRGGGRR